MDRGEIVLAPFAYADQEQWKVRPAVVVSAPEIARGPDVILAMVTSKQGRIDQPGLGDVVIDEWQKAGLLVRSVVRAARPMVIEQRRVRRAIGRLTVSDLLRVDDALREVFGLS